MAAPIARFSATCGSAGGAWRTGGVASAGAVGGATAAAPPWVRTTAPSAARRSRSRRMVELSTEKRAASAATLWKPCWATSAAISWRRVMALHLS